MVGAALLALTGCALLGDEVPIVGPGAVEDGGRVISLGVATCNQSGHRVSVDEAGDEVVVTVRVLGGIPSGPRHLCADVVRVELHEPLGDRAVRDGASGEPIETYGAGWPEDG